MLSHTDGCVLHVCYDRTFLECVCLDLFQWLVENFEGYVFLPPSRFQPVSVVCEGYNTIGILPSKARTSTLHLPSPGGWTGSIGYLSRLMWLVPWEWHHDDEWGEWCTGWGEVAGGGGGDIWERGEGHGDQQVANGTNDLHCFTVFNGTFSSGILIKCSTPTNTMTVQKLTWAIQVSQIPSSLFPIY